VSTVDWASVRAMRLPGRSPGECESRWLWFEDPTVNAADGVWTASEDADLAQLAEAHGGYGWEEVSEALRVLNEKSSEAERVARPVRSPAACLRRYQTRVLAAQRFGQRPWTSAEDAELTRLLALHGPGNWSLIGQAMKRTGHQVQHRAKRQLVPGKKKGKWDAAEDAALRAAVAAFGVGAWARVAGGVPGRTDVQCRERYVNCLAPGLDKSPWRGDEDVALLAAVEQLRQPTQGGGKVPWCEVAKLCAPRTDYQCACRWEALKKQQGKASAGKVSAGGSKAVGAGSKKNKKKKAALEEDEESGGSDGGEGCGRETGARPGSRQHLARAKKA
jgi:myb proto-oncogene protein